MGKNILTGWLHVMAKDFKILLKNKFLLLIYLSVIFALMLIGAFIAFYIYPQILDLFDLSKFGGGWKYVVAHDSLSSPALVGRT